MKGSKVVYAEPHDELNQMKRAAQAQLPQTTRGQDEVVYKEMQEISEGKELNAVRTRRQALDDRINYDMQSDQMMSQLRAARIPGLRGQGSKMMGAERAARLVFAG